MSAEVQPRRTAAGLESVGLLLVAVAVTLRAEWPILFHAHTYQTDAMIHEWWMRQWRDPALFPDPLTSAVKATGFVPDGLRALDYLAAYAIDPVRFASWLPLVLVPGCAWLVFRVVRMHEAWRPAAWIGALLFLAPVDIERFSGGHARAFGVPIVLLTLYLLVRGWTLAAAAAAVIGILFYPPAALVAVGTLGLTAVARRRPDVHGLVVATIAAIACLAVTAATGFHVAISESDARAGGEFGANGQLHFFVPSLRQYLSQNYSGFDLQGSGSIVLMAAVLALALAPRRVPRAVWAALASSLVLFALAQLLLFRLYLPNRYVEPLVPVLAIAAAIGWRSSFDRLGRRFPVLAALLVPLAVTVIALVVFPLGPQKSVADLRGAPHAYVVALALTAILAVAVARVGRTPIRTVAACALVAGVLVAMSAYLVGGGVSPGAQSCGDLPLMSRLGRLAPSAVIAGDPAQMNCVPIAAQRPVVISRKLNQPLEADYAAIVRARMRAMVEAEFAPTTAPLRRLVTAFGARYLVVRHKERPRAMPEAWQGNQPYTSQIEQLLRDPRGPAVQRLGQRCLIWRHGADRLYDLGCLTRT